MSRADNYETKNEAEGIDKLSSKLTEDLRSSVRALVHFF